MLFIPRSLSLLIFSGYDAKCAMYEEASIVNCTQRWIVSHPEHWVLTWLVISNASSLYFIVVVWLLHKQLSQKFMTLKKLYRKASFWTMIFYFIATAVYYGLRFDTTDGMSVAMSLMLFLWCPLTLLVVFVFNYLLPVQWPHRNESNEWDHHEMWLCLVYWASLCMYLAENLGMFIAVTLDAALDLAPLMTKKYQHEGDHFHSFVLILVGLRVVFDTQLLVFFLYKICHGDRDLFSEPSDKLLELPNGSTERQVYKYEALGEMSYIITDSYV